MKVLKLSALLLLMLSTGPGLAQTRDVRALFPNAHVQTLANGNVLITPLSSIPQPGTGKSHTNVHIVQPAGGMPTATVPGIGPPVPGLLVETPASLACLYGLTPHVNGCNPNKVLALSKGGARTIAIVDAFDAPNSVADLASFNTQFGLPPANFEVVYAAAGPSGASTNTPPAYDAGWELEISLDTQYAHAMAPKAKIILVEAASNSDADLHGAVVLASNLVALTGGEVSNSYGESEYSTEANDDVFFTTPGVVYFASSGDTPGTEYPCVSPKVVCVGGTTIIRNPTSGNFSEYTAWNNGGGGLSTFEPRPAFQNSITKIVGAFRGAPDVAADASPASPVWVLISGQGGWFEVYGTSVASPVVAAIANYENSFRLSSNTELTHIYAYSSKFIDVTQGNCTTNIATKGWDFCTGWGSPWVPNALGF
jgi:kumamolisin